MATGVHYEVSSITSNPGIYYEKLPSIRIQKGSWKVIIHPDLHAFLKEHGPTRSYDKQLSQCTAHFDAKHCQATLNQDLIEIKLRTLQCNVGWPYRPPYVESPQASAKKFVF